MILLQQMAQVIQKIKKTKANNLVIWINLTLVTMKSMLQQLFNSRSRKKVVSIIGNSDINNNNSKNKSDNACANTSRSFRAEEQTFL